jgi:hypothetical protein
MSNLLQTFIESSLKDMFIHYILPIIFFLFALATLIFAPMRWRWKILLAIIFAVAGAVLLGWINIPGVSV